MSKLIVSLPWRTKPTTALGASHAAPGTASAPMTALFSGWDYSFALVNDANSLISSGKAALNALPTADKTILVAPAQALSWHQLDLPRMPKARLRAALDGLLEERLLDDTDAMSFAVSPSVSASKANTAAWVVACDKAWLTGAIALFESAGCRVTQIVPEYWPPSSLPNSASDSENASDAPPAIVCVTGTAEDAWLTRVAVDGVLTLPLHSKDATGAINALLNSSAASTAFPVDAAVLAEPAVAALAEQALARPVVLRQHAVSLIESAQSPWELAQFEQRLSGDGEGIKRLRRAWQAFWQSSAWRPARWGLVTIFVANVVGLNAWAWQQQASLAAKKAQLSAVLTQTFANVKVVVDPPLQMGKELALLRQATGSISTQNFEAMLSAFGVANASNVEPHAIDFSANTAVLKGVKLPESERVNMQSKLKAAGYAIKIDSNKATIKADESQ